MQNTWSGLLYAQRVDGPTITAAGAISAIVSASAVEGQYQPIIPGGLLVERTSLRLLARGIISCVVTTPGTARFDIRMGSTVVFDTGALNLNIVAKTSVPWTLDVDLTVEKVGKGTLTQFMGIGTFASEAVVGAPLPTVGGNGILNVPVSSIALGTGFDNSIANTMDLFFTQTLGTGSMTLKTCKIWIDN